MPPLAFVMWTLIAKTLWDRIVALAEPVFREMDIPAKVRKNFIRKRTFLIKQLCRCKVIYFSKLSLTIILLDLKLFRVSNLLFITRAFRGKRSKYKFGFFFFFFGFSHKTQFHYSTCVKCKRMRRMNPRTHGLKQWLPSWTIPCLMYAKKFDGYYAQYIYKVTHRSR